MYSFFSSVMYVVSTNAAHATTLVPLTTEQIVDLSNTIVKGTVTEVWTEPDPVTHAVWTYAQVEVSSVLKGEKETNVVILEQPGGSFGQINTTVEGVARFSVGEEGYFFVEELDSGKNVTAGMFQGKYNIVLDPYSREEIVVRFSVHPNRKFDHRFIPLPSAKDMISVHAFEANIQTYVANGWDGTPIPGVSMEKLQKINTKPTDTSATLPNFNNANSNTNSDMNLGTNIK